MAMQYPRRLARLLILAPVTIAMAAMPLLRSAQAAGLKTRLYVSATEGYRFTYPADWKVLRVSSVDCFLQSQDGQAVINATATHAAGSVARLLADQNRAIAGYGQVQGRINSMDQRLGGLRVRSADAMVLAHGKREEVALVDIVHDRYLYKFVALVKLDSPDAEQQLRQVSESYNSIQVR